MPTLSDVATAYNQIHTAAAPAIGWLVAAGSLAVAAIVACLMPRQY